jgi:hypothetical protein
MADDDKDYEVGYGKPPKHTQFKPGRSGNPKGRPKDTRNVKHVLLQVATEEMAITENGETKVVSKQEALIRSLFARALNGDQQATRILLKLWERYSGLYMR